jgi:hypothetical protein
LSGSRSCETKCHDRDEMKDWSHSFEVGLEKPRALAQD